MRNLGTLARKCWSSRGIALSGFVLFFFVFFSFFEDLPGVGTAGFPAESLWCNVCLDVGRVMLCA